MIFLLKNLNTIKKESNFRLCFLNMLERGLSISLTSMFSFLYIYLTPNAFLNDYCYDIFSEINI